MKEIGLDNVALLVIDVQNAFCHPSGSLAKLGKDIDSLVRIREPCRELVAVAHSQAVPVIYTRNVYRADYSDRGVMAHEIRPALKEVQSCVHGTWDAELTEEFIVEQRDYCFDKSRPSAFFNCGVDTVLRNLNITTVVICGVTTSICVESTVRDASQRDYRTFVVSDAVAELEHTRHDASLVTMEYFFAHIIGLREILSQWG